ncbi:DUF4382 domain-containing protein [Thalassolituus sp. LLYu03]|uniref:DUF4382 domain-containing protein n=1 Tax=Thalassolituus sp. LLYu03 TaxID=3421656 RepID=UPI003D29F2FB
MNNTIRNSLTLTALCAALAGCGTSSSDGSGQLTLSLTDAPVTSLQSVSVTITGVSLKPASGDTLTYTFEEPKTLDLLQLQGGETALLLNDVTVPAGAYNWLRLAVDSDNLSVTETGGALKTLKIPSGAETGLKLVKGFTVAQGGSSAFTIDFDVRKSIVDPTGNSADYFLKPVLRLVDNLQVGSVAGTVTGELISAACADSNIYAGMVYVFSGADATADDLGSSSEPLVAVPVVYDAETTTYQYSAAFLEVGDYSLSYSCDADDNEQDEALTFTAVQNASVTQGDTTGVNFDLAL